MSTLTKREKETIANNLGSFVRNFGEVRIEKVTGYGYYLYYPADAPEGEYIQFCTTIDYLDGFLYGIVIGMHKRELFEKGWEKTKFLEEV